MSTPLRFSIVLVTAICMAGCATDRERVALESELREKSAQIRELEQQLAKSNELLNDQDAELIALRDSAFSPSGKTPTTLISATATPERLVAWGSVNAIRIHRLTSGIVPSDDTASPMINVVIQPVDADGDLVKIAGRLRVTAQLMNDEIPGRQIAAAEFDLPESRRLWSQGLVSSGLHATLRSIEPIPEGATLMISASLDLGNDRRFSTVEIITGH